MKVKTIVQIIYIEHLLESAKLLSPFSIRQEIWHLYKKGCVNLWVEDHLWYCDGPKVYNAYKKGVPVSLTKEDEEFLDNMDEPITYSKSEAKSILLKVKQRLVDFDDPPSSHQCPPEFGTDWYFDEDGDLWNEPADYCIEKERAGEVDWIEHLTSKCWCDMDEFIPCFLKLRGEKYNYED